MGVLFVVTGLTFRSLVIPVRSVLSIGLTLAFSFGFVTLIYQYGMLDWLGFYGWQNHHAVYWLAPVLSFTVIVGIALDYDVFLLVRIKEARVSGLDTRTAILTGLTRTGSVITAAGLVMAIAFSGLLFSQTPMLNVITCVMGTAVVFDTFVVRTLLVPPLMSLLGDLNWFPSKMPPALGLRLKQTTAPAGDADADSAFKLKGGDSVAPPKARHGVPDPQAQAQAGSGAGSAAATMLVVASGDRGRDSDVVVELASGSHGGLRSIPATPAPGLQQV